LIEEIGAWLALVEGVHVEIVFRPTSIAHLHAPDVAARNGLVVRGPGLPTLGAAIHQKRRHRALSFARPEWTIKSEVK
jgi:hypothetical protein